MSRGKKIVKAVLKLLKYSLYFILLCILVSRFLLPNPEFDKPTSTVVFASNGQLIGAKIAKDEQWRFAQIDSVPRKYEEALLLYEDQYFNYHFGFNPVSFFRAAKVNYKAGRVVQGGSTITMQLARIYLGNKDRSIWQKLKELLVAFHFEINYSKDEILSMYASNAPYGGNVVGLSSASWRYFGRSIDELSWAESAMFAVLPNAPSLIFPGRNKQRLKDKRDALLDRLFEEGTLSEEELNLAKLEPIPLKPLPLPVYAKHFIDRMVKEREGNLVESSLDYGLQRKAQEKVNNYVRFLQDNKIYNACAIVIDNSTQNILAYVGNSTLHKDHGNQVDIIQANRSTGSVLKPFLYASMITKEELLPNQLIDDIPTYYKGYTPKNFFKDFDGVVTVKEALYRSLNVPFVRLLQEYKVDRFYGDLKMLGMNSLVYSSDHYGLSLILGGAEGNLYNLSSIYSGMSRQISTGEYTKTLSYDQSQVEVVDPVCNDVSIYHAFDAIKNAKRPASQSGWKSFSSSRKVAWKTGTSWGSRDAWAIGVTPEYTVGVWVGNADGEGRPGLTGLSAAAPLMFDIYAMLGETSWWDAPTEEINFVDLCVESGMLPSVNCNNTYLELLAKSEKSKKMCTYHKKVHLDKNREYQVHADCQDLEGIIHDSWFILSPLQEWFYKKKTPLYRSLPPYRSDCQGSNQKVMEFIYPNAESKLFIPVDIDGEKSDLVFKLTHQNANTNVYWYLDEVYLGQTFKIHEIAFQAEKGSHVVTVMDDNGDSEKVRFEVISE